VGSLVVFSTSVGSGGGGEEALLGWIDLPAQGHVNGPHHVGVIERAGGRSRDRHHRP
jgi:hypothetical protein